MRALVLAAAVLLVAACGGASEEAATPAQTADGAIAGTTLDGKPLSLADLQGKPVLVNVWSSW